MALGIRLKSWWDSKFSAWVDRQSPLSRQHSLNLKNLYIFPTLTGLMFLLLALLIWLLGTNYQNNLILALAYLQLSLIVVVILHTFNNLAGVTVRVLGFDYGYAGHSIAFHLEFSTQRKKGCDSLCASWGRGEKVIFDLEPGQSLKVTVWAESAKRGIFKPGRLHIYSTFPMGIIRCWTWQNLSVEAIVFPKVVECAFPSYLALSGEGNSSEQLRSGDDFYGFKSFQPGHSLKHIAWKHYAQDRGLFCKEFASAAEEDTWLNWDDFNCGALELSLSNMSYWVTFLAEKHQYFGLRLPGVELPPGTGEAHKIRCLCELAQFNPGPNK